MKCLPLSEPKLNRIKQQEPGAGAGQQSRAVKKVSSSGLNGGIDPVSVEDTPSRGTDSQRWDRCSLDICPGSLTLKLLISSARELVNPVKQWVSRNKDTIREGNRRVRAPNNVTTGFRKNPVHTAESYSVINSHWTHNGVIEPAPPLL